MGHIKYISIFTYEIKNMESNKLNKRNRKKRKLALTRFYIDELYPTLAQYS